MGRGFNDLLDCAKKLRLKGDSLATMRKKLLKAGWDMNTIDRALWQVGFRDRKNIYFLQQFKKYGYGLLAIIVFVTVVSVVVVIDRSRSDSDGQEAHVAGDSTDVQLTGNPVHSEGAGIRFDVPVSWEVKDVESNKEGVHVWQIEPATNRDVKKQLESRYGVGDGSGEASTANFALLSDPLVDQLTTVSILVTRAESNQIEGSIHEWKQNIDVASGQFGLTAQNFTRIERDGVDGYAYESLVELGELRVATLELVYIDETKRVEISVYPINSDRSSEIEAVLRSIQL